MRERERVAGCCQGRDNAGFYFSVPTNLARFVALHYSTVGIERGNLLLACNVLLRHPLYFGGRVEGLKQQQNCKLRSKDLCSKPKGGA